MKNSPYLLLLLPLLSLAPVAQNPQNRQGQDPERALERLLRRFDENGDRRISQDEFPGPAGRFRRLDRDGDGFLDRRDLPAPAPQPTGPDMPVATDSDLEFFEKRIRPVLADRCFRCHSADGDKIKGGLVLDNIETILQGGTSGPAVVRGNPDASLLIMAIRYTDEDLEMPPKRALSAEIVRDFETWVEQGAHWPASSAIEGPTLGEHGVDIEAGRAWWSFQPPTKVPAPEVTNESWPWTDIDRFLLATMEAKGLAPVGDADDVAWLRRVSLDLVGLQPTPEESRAFELDKSETRFGNVVDRLLASPRFGERWGRHWLDVARYAESSGRDSNLAYPHAWRYRDYVIEAFDEGLPFDQFLIEQLAGDLLPAEDATQRANLAIATGYLAVGSKAHNTRDPRQFNADLADEQVDSLTQGMLGLTVSCARCHDHKFDPIPAEDYYAMAGIFRSTETLYGTFPATANRHPAALTELPEEATVAAGSTMDPAILRLLQRQQDRLAKEVDGYDEPMGSDRRGRPGMESDGEMTSEEARRTRRQQLIRRDSLRAIDNLLRRFDDNGKPTNANRRAMGVREGRAANTPLLIRGEFEAVGPLVPRGVPQVLGDRGLEIPDGASGRLELAKWVGSSDNPLTARVWTNRAWLHLFGNGLVSTPNNFGASGQLPSHPELLDWLAVTFMENDEWSTKSLIRRLVLSHTYHLSSTPDARNARQDPEVVYLWRMPERRLDAEVIRDSMLASGGLLELERPGGSLVNSLEGQPRQQRFFQFLSKPTKARSVYLPALRDRIPEALEVFDAADPSFVAGDRQETSVATQALYLMNAEEVLEAADGLATRIQREASSTGDRIQLAYQLTLARTASSSEVRAVKSFLKDYKKFDAPEPKDQGDRRRGRNRPVERPRPDAEFEAWSAFAQALFQCAEFRYAG